MKNYYVIKNFNELVKLRYEDIKNNSRYCFLISLFAPITKSYHSLYKIFSLSEIELAKCIFSIGPNAIQIVPIINAYMLLKYVLYLIILYDSFLFIFKKYLNIL